MPCPMIVSWKCHKFMVVSRKCHVKYCIINVNSWRYLETMAFSWNYLEHIAFSLGRLHTMAFSSNYCIFFKPSKLNCFTIEYFYELWSFLHTFFFSCAIFFYQSWHYDIFLELSSNCGIFFIQTLAFSSTLLKQFHCQILAATWDQWTKNKNI